MPVVLWRLSRGYRHRTWGPGVAAHLGMCKSDEVRHRTGAVAMAGVLDRTDVAVEALEIASLRAARVLPDGHDARRSLDELLERARVTRAKVELALARTP